MFIEIMLYWCLYVCMSWQFQSHELWHLNKKKGFRNLSYGHYLATFFIITLTNLSDHQKPKLFWPSGICSSEPVRYRWRNMQHSCIKIMQNTSVLLNFKWRRKVKTVSHLSPCHYSLTLKPCFQSVNWMHHAFPKCACNSSPYKFSPYCIIRFYLSNISDFQCIFWRVHGCMLCFLITSTKLQMQIDMTWSTLFNVW